MIPLGKFEDVILAGESQEQVVGPHFVLDVDNVGHNWREGYRGDVLFGRMFRSDCGWKLEKHTYRTPVVGFDGCNETLRERVSAGIVVGKLTDFAIHDDSLIDSAHVCVPRVLPDSNSAENVP